MENHLHVLFNDYFKDYLKFNPLHATVIGKHKYDDQLPNFYSDEYNNNLRDTLQNYLDLANDEVAKSHSDHINLEAFKDMLSLQIEGLNLPFNELPISQMSNIFLEITSLIVEPGLQPLVGSSGRLRFPQCHSK